jgi:hypothetical protein
MIFDPDYARAFSIIRCTAWSYGYAATLHGSYTRDLDIVLIPWTGTATKEARPLVKLLSERLGWPVQHEGCATEFAEKPHGRKTWTLNAPAFGDPRWIDISVMPMGSKDA